MWGAVGQDALLSSSFFLSKKKKNKASHYADMDIPGLLMC